MLCLYGSFQLFVFVVESQPSAAAPRDAAGPYTYIAQNNTLNPEP